MVRQKLIDYCNQFEGNEVLNESLIINPRFRIDKDSLWFTDINMSSKEMYNIISQLESLGVTSKGIYCIHKRNKFYESKSFFRHCLKSENLSIVDLYKLVLLKKVQKNGYMYTYMSDIHTYHLTSFRIIKKPSS